MDRTMEIGFDIWHNGSGELTSATRLVLTGTDRSKPNKTYVTLSER